MGKKIVKQISLDDLMGEPIITPIEESCSETFYLYGKGPFYFNSEVEEEEGGSTTAAYDSDIPDLANIALYNTNEHETRIFARAKRDRYPDPETNNYRISKQRAYLKFYVPPVNDVAYINDSWFRINVYPGFRSSDIYDPKFYRISPVTEQWSPQILTWNSQPSVSGLSIEENDFLVLDENENFLQFDITSFLEFWDTNPNQQFGIRFSVANDDMIPPDYHKEFVFYSPRSNNKPYVQIRFKNTEWDSTFIDVHSVAKGDTITVTYQNETPNDNLALQGYLDNYDVAFNNKIYPATDFRFYGLNFKDSCTDRGFGYTDYLHTRAFITGEDSLHIAMEVPDQNELWPTIPEGGARAEFDFDQVENTIEEVIVEVTQNEEPIEEQSVIVTAEWVPGSGGHDHEAATDSLQPPLERMGWIVNIEEADSLQGELPTVTNSDGQIRLRYRTPEFAGEVKLIAKTVNDHRRYPAGRRTTYRRST